VGGVLVIDSCFMDGAIEEGTAVVFAGRRFTLSGAIPESIIGLVVVVVVVVVDDDDDVVLISPDTTEEDAVEVTIVYNYSLYYLPFRFGEEKWD
jgi:hypothetical protein